MHECMYIHTYLGLDNLARRCISTHPAGAEDFSGETSVHRQESIQSQVEPNWVKLSTQSFFLHQLPNQGFHPVLWISNPSNLNSKSLSHTCCWYLYVSTPDSDAFLGYHQHHFSHSLSLLKKKTSITWTTAGPPYKKNDWVALLLISKYWCGYSPCMYVCTYIHT